MSAVRKTLLTLKEDERPEGLISNLQDLLNELLGTLDATGVEVDKVGAVAHQFGKEYGNATSGFDAQFVDVINDVHRARQKARLAQVALKSFADKEYNLQRHRGD